MMKNSINPLIKLILKQELIYGLFLIFIGLVVTVQHGIYIGLKSFGYSFVFMQVIIILVNWKAILDYIESNET